MSRRSTICASALLLQVGLLASPQPQLNADLDGPLQAGIRNVLLQKYAEAESTFSDLSSRFPESPAGPLFHAAAINQASADLGIEFNTKIYDSLLTLVHVRVSRNGESQDAWNKIFLSTSKGMLAVRAAEEGVWLSAIRDALTSATLAQEVLESDTSLADAALPLGNYYYWKTRKTEFFSWVPFREDGRERGFALLRRCYEQGRYQRYAALNSLVWLMIDAGRWSEAEEYARIGIRAYPQNRTFLRGLASSLENTGRYGEAASIWTMVLATLSEEGKGGLYSEYAAHINRARCLFKGAQIPDCAKELDLAERMKPESVPDAIRPHFESKQVEAKDLSRNTNRHSGSR